MVVQILISVLVMVLVAAAELDKENNHDSADMPCI